MLALMKNAHETAAANDTNYGQHRCRTLPILATVSPIANYPTKLRIFLTNASRYWQVRCFFKGKTYTQSLRTTIKQAAISQAKQFFHIKTAELYGEQIRVRETATNKFADIVPAALALQQARVIRGELTAASLRILQNRLHKTILPFFGEMDVTRIGYTQLSNFLSKLSADAMTTTTIQQHIVATRKILTYAYSINLIAAVPKFPTIKVSSKPRGSFSVGEYRRLVAMARAQTGARVPIKASIRNKRAENSIERFATVSDDLRWLIRFMVNSFIRPSDIKNLQHKHIAIIKGKHTYLRLNLPESKKHDKPIVTLRSAVFVYERLFAHYSALELAGDDDYLFMPQQRDRGKALEFLGWQFKYVQQQTSIGKNAANGSTRTLYSLRHTAITFRLLYGQKIDLLTLARNARTSVEMVEKFYASELSGEMNIDLLQGKRR